MLDIKLNNKIRVAMDHHQAQIREYDDEIVLHINKHGNDNSEYLIHRRLMTQYHRGAWNALLALTK